MALPPGIHPAWWNGPMPQANPFNPGFLDCGMDFRPPGGFVNLLQTGQQPFVPSHVSLPPPWPPTAPATDSATQHAKSRSKAKSVINIDDGDEVRTTKRLTWSPDEDLRLVSAWLYHSNDPINGNGKKNDSYWGDVVELYNSTTLVSRKREVKHLKDRWQRIKRWVGFFCASWKKATSIYTSGYSDDQLRNMANQFYVEDYKEGPFTVLHCWKVLRHEPKWHASHRVLTPSPTAISRFWLVLNTINYTILNPVLRVRTANNFKLIFHSSTKIRQHNHFLICKYFSFLICSYVVLHPS